MKTKTCIISETLALPMSIVTIAAAVVGVRGSGKTNTGVVIAEDVLDAGQQLIVIDPLDVWWGLKSSADGKSAGYPITVLGGAHQDVPLAAGDGKTIADFLAEHRVPAILSLRHLRKGEQRKFVTEFAEQLFHRKGDQDKKTPVLVVIDEASQFCPQRVMGEDARMVGAIQDIVRLGRSSGLGAMLIDQRPASINKDVLTQIEMLVAHRVTSPQDRKALQEWVQAKASADQEKEFLAGLASLKRGEAYFWSPEWLNLFERVQVRARRTFDSSATPEGGKAVATPKTLAPVELDALRSKLAATIEKAKADDPKELKRQLAQVQRELAKATAQASATASKRETKQTRRVVEKPIVDEKTIARLEKLVEREETALAAFQERVNHLAGSLVGQLCQIRDRVGSIVDPVKKVAQMAATSAMVVNPTTRHVFDTRPTSPGHAAAARRPTPVLIATNPASGDLPDWFRPAHQKLINAIHWLGSKGMTEVERSTAAAMAGVSPRSSSFKNDISRLSANGFLTYPGSGSVALTDQGRSFAVTAQHLPTLDDLHNAWRACPALRPAHVKLINILIDAYPHDLSRDTLAEQAGVSSGSSSFKNDVSRLSAMELAMYPTTGRVKAGRLLFPEGMA